MREIDVSRRVRCNCGSVDAIGTYEVAGKHLLLKSRFGTKKVLLGFSRPQRLAQKLLKNICEKEAAVQKVEMQAMEVPAPEVVEALEAIDRPQALARTKADL